MSGNNLTYLLIFGRSLFEVLSLFFIGTITFYCCKSNSKENKTETNKKEGVSKIGRRSVVVVKPVEKKEEGNAGPPPVPNPTTSNKAGANNTIAGNTSKKKKTEKIVNVTKADSQIEIANVLPPDDFLPFQKTVYENVHNPAVHERALKVAAEGLIVDPRQTTYGGNIDSALEKDKLKRYNSFQKDLANADQASENTMKNEPGRVKIREDKCVLFETNEVPTEDEEEENNDAV